MALLGLQVDLDQIKNPHEEARLFTRRLLCAGVFVLLGFGVLITRFYTLQVVGYQDYVTRADSNRIQVQPIAPNRGLIFDRNGVLLADNRASYTLSVVKERAKKLDRLLEDLSDVVEISEEDVERFRKALKQRRRPFEATPLRYRLTEEEIARLAVNEYRLEGAEVEAQLVRYYPHGPLFAHTVGYVGRINERELSSFDDEDYQNYAGTYSVGKTGLERYYESRLLGQVGSQNVETNAHGRVLRVLDRIDPIPGEDLYLHVDYRLQKAAHDALTGKRGAVVAIDVQSGGVLALASTPSFNPNLFVTGISHADYRRLNESRDLPMYNRAVQGQYPPGSTLKPLLGLGALEHRIVTPSTVINDTGIYQLENSERLYRDWKKGGHGSRIDLRRAIEQSCDVYIWDMAYRMGVDRMHSVGLGFGLGTHTNIDIPNERSGLWPSRVWKKGARGLPWFPGDSLNMSLGQGDVLATPLQLAVMTHTMATRGVMRRPRLVSRISNTEQVSDVVHTSEFKKSHWQYIGKSMEAVVHGTRGTARAISTGLKYRIAGKTGTAQVVGIAQDEEYDREKVAERNRPHALFIAYAPAKNPRIAISVIVENGEAGSSAAAPVARHVIDAWFSIDRAENQGSTSVPTTIIGNTL